MYYSYSLHIFPNYIVKMVVCICWIIADCVPLIHFWVVEYHHPERVLRQFGMKQGIPVDVNTSTELHKITLQGKQHQNWAQVHALHIAKWAAHATITDAPPCSPYYKRDFVLGHFGKFTKTICYKCTLLRIV